MSTIKKTTARTTKPKAPAAKPSVTPKASPVQKAQGPELRKKELIEKVVARSGVKKKDAKPVIEAMLAELGECLASGRDMVLPPLGRAKINREKKVKNARIMIVKFRQRDKVEVQPAGDVKAAE